MSAARWACSACGAAPVGLPHACPERAARPELDHVLQRTVDLDALGADAFGAPAEVNPFVRFRRLLSSWHLALEGGLSDADFVALVRGLDAAVARADGHGFAATPLSPSQVISERVGATVWLKDETGNVSGSHKARHLMGVAIDLAVRARLGLPGVVEPPLAIASCGNAALAAGVVARAAGRALSVFIPPSAAASVVARLEALGADIVVCERQPGRGGDPTYHAFRDAVAAGALAFCCQGPDCGVTIEGGQTLGWEIAATLAGAGEALDHLFIQVGGGALGTATLRGLREALELGVIDRLPALHCVQTEGGYPLVRAWDRVTARAFAELGESVIEDRAARAARLQGAPHAVAAALAHARRHRGEFMWPWESEPKSVAHGILDDETYDWFALVEGTLATGGWPVLIDDASVLAAQRLAQGALGVPVCATGAAGLAGATTAVAQTSALRGRRVGVILSGRER